MQLQSVIIYNLQFDKPIYAYIRNMNNKMFKRVIENNSSTIISINNEIKKGLLQIIKRLFNKIYISITYGNTKNIVFHLDCLLKSDINNISYYEYLDKYTFVKVEHIRQLNNRNYYDVIVHISKSKPKTEILWASTREPYNYLQAKNCGCSIITMPPSIIEKISKFGKSYQDLTLDTVRKFLKDSKSSNFSI